MYSYNRPQNNNTGEMLRKIFLGKNVLSRLILINTVVFILANITGVVAWLIKSEPVAGATPLGSILALPADLTTLAIMPWTVFTYMFLQIGFFHILFNMIMLYFGGLIFQEYLSQKKLLLTYIMGGLTGALFFVAAFNMFPVFNDVLPVAVAMGASASVLAIIIAISTYVPDYTVHLFFFGRLKLKYLAIAFIVIDLLSIQRGNPGGHIAHLGGALWGFLYAFTLRNGTDIYGIFKNIKFSGFSKRRQPKFTTHKSGRPLSDDQYNKRKVATQKEIDHILDKISKSGYSSLTKSEKELLFKTSKKD